MKKMGKSALGSGGTLGYDRGFEEFKEEMARQKLEQEGAEQHAAAMAKSEVKAPFVEGNQPKEQNLFGMKVDDEDEEDEED